MTVLPFIRAYYPTLDAAEADLRHAEADFQDARDVFDHTDKHRVERYRSARARLHAAREWKSIAYRDELINRGRVS